jgi:hypothetical protein
MLVTKWTSIKERMDLCHCHAKLPTSLLL